MQKKKVRMVETFVTLIHDNISNIIIITIAVSIYNIELKASLNLWLIGQLLNITFSYSRRYIFDKYNNTLNKAL